MVLSYQKLNKISSYIYNKVFKDEVNPIDILMICYNWKKIYLQNIILYNGRK